MARNKNRNTKIPATGQSKLETMFQVGGLVLAVLLFIGYAWTRGAQATEPHAPRPRRSAAPTGDEIVTQMLADSEAMQADLSAWLDEAERVAAGDREATDLVRYARAQSIPSILGPNGMTQYMLRVEATAAASEISRLAAPPGLMTNRAFEFTVADSATRLRFGMEAASDWQFDQGRNELFVPPRDRFSPEIGATTFIHELQHVYDVNTGIEPMQPSPEQWAEGERRAYTIELRLLDRVTDGRSLTVVQDWVDRLRPSGGSWITVADIPHQAWLDWDAALGPYRSEQEQITRNGTFYVSLNREHARREGTDDDGFRTFLSTTHHNQTL